MSNLFSIVSVIVIFVIILISFAVERLDFVIISILGAAVAALILVFTYSGPDLITLETIIDMIEWKPLFFIFGIQIIIAAAEKRKIFHFIAVQSIQWTKGDARKLFYVMSAISTLTAAIIEDVTVAIIFAPLLIRTCKILEIEPAPYLFAMTITINIGSLITPFSSSQNIIISTHFSDNSGNNINMTWFAENLWILAIILLVITLILLEKFLLRKNKKPEKIRVDLIREILKPNMVLDNKPKAILNVSILIGVIICFFIFSEAYIVALIGAGISLLLNREKLELYYKSIEWNIILFLMSLYVIIGVMIKNGTMDYIDGFINDILPDNILVISLFILIFSSLFSGLLANSPTVLLFLALSDGIIAANPTIAANPNLIIITLIIGINIGGNFLPQGAECDLMTLSIATKNQVNGFNFKSLTKNGAIFALIHVFVSVIFIVAYYYIFY